MPDRYRSITSASKARSDALIAVRDELITAVDQEAFLSEVYLEADPWETSPFGFDFPDGSYEPLYGPAMKLLLDKTHKSAVERTTNMVFTRQGAINAMPYEERVTYD